MKVVTLLTRFAGVLGNNLQGFTPMEVLQAVVDDLWADEVPERIVTPPPYIVTLAGVLIYHFDAANTLSLTPIIAGSNAIRRVRGIFKPALAGSDSSDYNYKAPLPFDQNTMATRLYDGAVDIDNELRTIVFRADPGATTTDWKIDYYPKAPTLDETSDLPILPGEEMTLLFSGMRAFCEEWKSGSSEYWRPLYNTYKTEYRYKLRIDKNIPRIDENLIFSGDKTVGSQ